MCYAFTHDLPDGRESNSHLPWRDDNIICLGYKAYSNPKRSIEYSALYSSPIASLLPVVATAVSSSADRHASRHPLNEWPVLTRRLCLHWRGRMDAYKEMRE
jgi:hypothetical protein